MRKFFRSLSLILCFAMLFAAMPEAQLLVPMSVAAAEEEQPAAEQPAEVSEPDPTQEPTQVPEETEQPEETAVPEETAEAEVTLPPSEEVEVLPTEEVPDENEIDYTKDASFSPAFVSGYAKLKSDTSLYEGSGAKDEEIAVLGSGVVYAVVRDIGTECDRLQIVFNDGSEELARGWVDADRVTPMDPETDVPTFTRDTMTDDDVRIYNDKYPLLPVQCVYAAQEAIEAVAADDASAEANAVETSALKRPGVMTIKADRTTIGANTKAKLTITATAGHTMENYRLASDHENLLILDQPEKKGRNATATASKNVTKATTITIQLIALTDDALLDSIEIEVLPAPTASDIIVDREIRIGYKCTYQLNPTYKDGTMCDSFTYMIAEKDADYASVTQNGLVTAKSPIIGDTKKPVTIYIMPGNNTSARVECKLYILEAPERVTASRTKVTIGAGDSIDLVQACTLDYAPGIDESCAGQLTFKSSSSSEIGRAHV